MSLEEKAGQMFHMMIVPTLNLDEGNAAFGLPGTSVHLANGLSHFNLMGGFDTAREFAEFSNAVQAAALQKRWGIPVTLSSDPRHAFSENPQLSLRAGPFSQWPENIGMVALADPKRMQEYSDIVRQEYVAAGLRMALHPQADLATEPRWSRIAGSLGEDADHATALLIAQIRGLHGPEFGAASVATCTKHFPGGGPLKDGLDSHFQWGQEQRYPGGQWQTHLKPFRAAVAEGTRYIMPAYGRPMGTAYPEVAMAYNKPVLTGILRQELGYDGVVVSDWGVVTDLGEYELLGDLAPARAFGVEHLTAHERIIMSLDAGVDQYGGHYDPTLIIDVVRDGRVPEARIDESVRRILRDKFALGLFEHPYVDVPTAEATIGRKDFVAAGLAAQKDAVTLLKNGGVSKPLLPLPKTAKVYVEGLAKLAEAGIINVAATPEEADVAVVRLSTPWESVGTGDFCKRFHHGNLAFGPETLSRIAQLARKVPVVVEIYADRPPVLGSINDDATAIMLSFGINPAALVEVLYGHSPKGVLPFDIPRSMEAVAASKTDTAFDTKDPLYRFGHGLRYEGA
jgi:beta-glucosidase